MDGAPKRQVGREEEKYVESLSRFSSRIVHLDYSQYKILFRFYFPCIFEYSSLQSKLYFNEKFRLNYRRPGIKEGENIFEECVELSLSAIKFYFDSFFGHPPSPFSVVPRTFEGMNLYNSP